MSPVAEPASALLRRLDREATAGPWKMDTHEPLDFVLWGPAGEAVGNVGGLCVPVLTDDDMAANPEIHRIVEAERCDVTLIAALRNALPALADLVEAVEKMGQFCDCSFGGCDWTDAVHAANAALRERLAAKP